MPRQEIEYQGSVFCKVVQDDITVLLGRSIPDNPDVSSSSFVKVLCPYYRNSFWRGHLCEKGGKCGVAEGASN